MGDPMGQSGVSYRITPDCPSEILPLTLQDHCPYESLFFKNTASEDQYTLGTLIL